MKHTQLSPNIEYKTSAGDAPVADDQVSPAEPSQTGQNINWNCNACGHQSPRPLAISIKAFCKMVSCGRTSQWKLEKLGQIETRNVLGRKVVLTRSIDKLLDL